jgi:hypothetical protein
MKFSILILNIQNIQENTVMILEIFSLFKSLSTVISKAT